MTIAQLLEMKVTGRRPSDTPARAVSKVLGITPDSEVDKTRFNNLVHYFYGTMWGSVRGFLDVLRLNNIASTLSHFSAVWITGMILLPSLKISSPPWKWGFLGIATDGLFHLVYAFMTTLIYKSINQRWK